MMIHRIKIEQQYLIHIMEGKKNFEVRKNDRDYQVGDNILFLPIANEKDYEAHNHGFKGQEFKISYIHSGYGLEAGFVVLGIEG